jgi:hypothetical protein
MIEGREPPEIAEAGPWDEEGLRVAVLTALSAFDLDPRDDSPEDRKQRRSRK